MATATVFDVSANQATQESIALYVNALTAVRVVSATPSQAHAFATSLSSTGLVLHPTAWVMRKSALTAVHLLRTVFALLKDASAWKAGAARTARKSVVPTTALATASAS